MDQMLEDLQDDRTLNDVQRCVIWLSDVRALWCYGDGDMRFRNTCLEMAYLNGKHCFLREWNYRFGHVKHCYHELPTLYNGSQMQWKFIGRSTNNQKTIFILVKHKERLYLKSVGELVNHIFLSDEYWGYYLLRDFLVSFYKLEQFIACVILDYGLCLCSICFY